MSTLGTSNITVRWRRRSLVLCMATVMIASCSAEPPPDDQVAGITETPTVLPVPTPATTVVPTPTPMSSAAEPADPEVTPTAEPIPTEAPLAATPTPSPTPGEFAGLSIQERTFVQQARIIVPDGNDATVAELLTLGAQTCRALASEGGTDSPIAEKAAELLCPDVTPSPTATPAPTPTSAAATQAPAPAPTPTTPPFINAVPTRAPSPRCQESAVEINGWCYLLYGNPDLVDQRRVCPSQAPRNINGYCYTALGRAVTPTPAPPIYENCTEAWAAGAAPIYRGQHGYSLDLDGDADGIACEDPPR